MSIGNLPTNLYELLGEEGESTASKKAPAKSNTASSSSVTTSRPPKSGQDYKGKPVGNRGPSKQGSDPVDQDKRPRPPKRTDKKPNRGPDERLDRRSGTGRGKEIKKGGHGKANWGGPEVENQETPDTAVVEPEPEPEPETEEERKEREERERKREEERIKEERQITLDEYLKQKKPVGLALPQARQPGEGIDDKQKSQWASLPVDKPSTSTSVPEAKAEFGVSKAETVVASSQKNLAVLTEQLGINVRVKDDARARRARQRYEEEKRQQEGKDKYEKPTPSTTSSSTLLTEDPRLKNQKKKKGYSKAPVNTTENFPALSAKS